MEPDSIIWHEDHKMFEGMRIQPLHGAWILQVLGDDPWRHRPTLTAAGIIQATVGWTTYGPASLGRLEDLLGTATVDILVKQWKSTIHVADERIAKLSGFTVSAAKESWTSIEPVGGEKLGPKCKPEVLTRERLSALADAWACKDDLDKEPPLVRQIRTHLADLDPVEADLHSLMEATEEKDPKGAAVAEEALEAVRRVFTYFETKIEKRGGK